MTHLIRATRPQSTRPRSTTATGESSHRVRLRIESENAVRQIHSWSHTIQAFRKTLVFLFLWLFSVGLRRI
ncbi:hypothetical protein D0Y65_042679 [Glycine soja]|uniref:Uncharacterized protein n=1 Tax=Glycine soja TaxID=3848 RepID=A0A445GEE0_GLYSO|nr:hypothetical protein D0Y65_042679 [Glycine soja]